MSIYVVMKCLEYIVVIIVIMIAMLSPIVIFWLWQLLKLVVEFKEACEDDKERAREVARNRQMIEANTVSAKQKSVSLELEEKTVQMNSHYVELSAATPTSDQHMIGTGNESAKEESVSLHLEEKTDQMYAGNEAADYSELIPDEDAKQESVQIHSDHAELNEVEIAKIAKQNFDGMFGDDQKMVSSDSETEEITHRNSEEMYDGQEGDNLTNGGTLTTAGNEGEEGHDKYARIGVLLRAADPTDYEEYLDNFRREKVDDERLENYKGEYSKEHPLWKQLIPPHGVRKDFLDHLYAFAEV